MSEKQILKCERRTKETLIQMQLVVQGTRQIAIKSGLPFFDHLLEQLAFHANWDFQLNAEGDTQVDDHHLIEDVAIVLGDVLNDYRQQTPALQRYGQRVLPMDGTLVLCATDADGRGVCVTDLPFTREIVGGIATEMWPHFFRTFSQRAGITLHIKCMHMDNHHHLIEASFKALARALKESLLPLTETEKLSDQSLSTKGCL